MQIEYIYVLEEKSLKHTLCVLNHLIRIRRVQLLNSDKLLIWCSRPNQLKMKNFKNVIGFLQKNYRKFHTVTFIVPINIKSNFAKLFIKWECPKIHGTIKSDQRVNAFDRFQVNKVFSKWWSLIGELIEFKSRVYLNEDFPNIYQATSKKFVDFSWFQKVLIIVIICRHKLNIWNV